MFLVLLTKTFVSNNDIVSTDFLFSGENQFKQSKILLISYLTLRSVNSSQYFYKSFSSNRTVHRNLYISKMHLGAQN